MPLTCTPSTSTSYVARDQKDCAWRNDFGSCYFSHLAKRAHRAERQGLPGVLSTYKLRGEIGKGSYGVVYRALNSEGRYVAVKAVRVEEEEGLSETCIREILLLQELASSSRPNVINIRDVVVTSGSLYLVTDLLEMDLRSWVKANGASCRLRGLKHIARSILTGVLHCHRRGVMHRDVKPHNVFITQDLSQVKLGDFGLARYFHDVQKTLTHEVVTLWYRAPEVLLGECQYNESIDIWAVGCILAELWTGRPLFTGDSEIDTLFKIFVLLGTPASRGEWPLNAFEAAACFPRFKGSQLASVILPQNHHPAVAGQCELFIDLLMHMLRVDPRRRASALVCLRHPFLS